MIDQLWQALQEFGSGEMAQVGFGALLLALAVSLASSLFIAYLYQTFYRARATGSYVHHAFPLMGLAITGIFVSVQFSLPLSLGLLGALSIVRFRTPIKEPEEIGFILLVIATSLTAATFNLGFLAMLLAVAVVALFIIRSDPSFLSRRSPDGMFMITLPAEQSADVIAPLVELLTKQVPAGSVDSIAEADGEVSISYRLSRITPLQTPALIAAVKAASSDARASVFFYRAGDA
jgi:hypothetical protein